MRTHWKRLTAFLLCLLLVLQILPAAVFAGNQEPSDATFTMTAKGVQTDSQKFGNALIPNDGAAITIPEVNPGPGDVALTIPAGDLKFGEENSFWIYIGNKKGYYDDTVAPSTQNHDDFDVSNFQLELGDGTVRPAKVVAYYAVDKETPASQNHTTTEVESPDATYAFKLGDGNPAGSNLSLAYKLEIVFDLTDYTGVAPEPDVPEPPVASGYAWNLEDGSICRGTMNVVAQAPALENIGVTLDGTALDAGSAANEAVFTMRGSGIQTDSQKFFNAIVVNNGDDLKIPETDSVSVTVPATDLVFGAENVVTIYIGNTQSHYDDTVAPSTRNHDDFDVWDFALTLASGQQVQPEKVIEYRAVDKETPASQQNRKTEYDYTDPNRHIKLGDGSPGSTNVDTYAYKAELIFDLTEYSNDVKCFPIDTTAYADGAHTLQLLDGEETKATAQVTFDNTAPVISLSIEDGAQLLQGETLNATVSDATSGLADSEALLDGETVNLPYSTAPLSLGNHSLSVTATDRAGNSSTENVNFILTANTITVSNPATAETDDGTELSVVPSIPGGGEITVHFYAGTAIDDIAIRGNSTSDMSLSEREYAGEQTLVEQNGYYVTDAQNDMPYQTFDVAAPTGDETVHLSYTGHTTAGERLALWVWNPENEAWDKVDSGLCGGSDITLSADVTASDYDDNGTIRARVAPEIAENGSNTILWVTDTQYYTQQPDYASDGTYEKIMEWAKEQYEAHKISYVTHTGDLVETVGNESQWKIADAAHDILDEAGIPNGVASGNHDVGTVDNLRYDLYWKYFGEDRYQDNFWYGGSMENNKNSYTLFTVGDKDFIALYLGMGEENTPETIAWANSVLQQYSHRNAIVNLHQYNNPNGSYTTDRAPDVFEQIVAPNDNVVLVLCGHDPGASCNVKQVPGKDRTVIELMSDYQDYNRGGDGFIRLLTFEDGKLYNHTYSPVTEGEYPFGTEKDEFTLDLTLQDANRSVCTKDFSAGVITQNELGSVTVESGGTASITTEQDLSGWYVTAVRDDETVTSPVYGFSKDPGQTPMQVVAHVGADFTTGMNVTWTTAEDTVTQVLVRADEEASRTITGTSSQGADGKYFHNVTVSGLTPDTDYTYIVGSGSNTVTGVFHTAPTADSRDSFSFVYLADPQISSAAGAEATGAVFQQALAQDADFTYIAGDITDNGTNENQYEWLFENGGMAGDAGDALMRSKPLAVVRGNHDNDAFNGHINVPDSAGANVYAFDYGPAKFIMLNLQNTSDEDRAQQEQFLRAEAAEAEENGQWIIVGFHKSIYTGGSHITDSDVISARKYWSPILAELDVDLVMQGHDHVYARGFVDQTGNNPFHSDGTVVESGSTVEKPDNAPLYVVGGHSGGLKWYNTIDYTVSDGDPLLPDYDFLDVNSANGADEPGGSDDREEQTYIVVSVSEDAITLRTYFFKYDADSHTITTDPYLYDTITVERDDVQSVPDQPTGSGSSSHTASVKVEKSENGTVTATPSSASEGSTVTITVKPDDGYVLDTLTVTDSSGKTVKLTKASDTRYTFTMPASAVTVKAAFVDEGLPFTDVNGHWALNAIEYVYDNGMMNGTTSTKFGPKLELTRGMLVTILYRLEKEPAISGSAFTDVDGDAYYAAATAWAAANGIVTGYADGTFGPEDAITREQLAVILCRYASYKGYDVSKAADLSAYTDAAAISAYAEDAMAWANAEGLVTGVTASTLNPRGTASRAQVATILMRFCENIAK